MSLKSKFLSCKSNIPSIFTGILIGAVAVLNISVAIAAPGTSPPNGDVTPTFSGLRFAGELNGSVGYEAYINSNRPSTDLVFGSNFDTIDFGQAYISNRGGSGTNFRGNVNFTSGNITFSPNSTATRASITVNSDKTLRIDAGDLELYTGTGLRLGSNSTISSSDLTASDPVTIDDNLNVRGSISNNGSSNLGRVKIADALDVDGGITSTRGIWAEDDIFLAEGSSIRNEGRYHIPIQGPVQIVTPNDPGTDNYLLVAGDIETTGGGQIGSYYSRTYNGSDTVETFSCLENTYAVSCDGYTTNPSSAHIYSYLDDNTCASVSRSTVAAKCT